MSETEETDYSSLTVVRLRELCKQRGIKVGGVKKEVIERLIENDETYFHNSNDNDNTPDSVNQTEVITDTMAASFNDSNVIEDTLSADGNNGGEEAVIQNESLAIQDANETYTSPPGSVPSPPRSGVAEDAELLAELRAISNKSSSGRFQDEDKMVAEEEQLVENRPDDNNDDDDAKYARNNLATDEQNTNKVINADEVGGEEFDEDELDDDAFLPNAATDAEDEKQLFERENHIISTDERKNGFECEADKLEVVSNIEPLTLDDRPFSSSFDDNKSAGVVSVVEEVSDSVSHGHVTNNESYIQGKETEQPKMSNTGIQSNLPNTFNGINGGIAEDADLLAELRAISNKSAGNRFDEEVDYDGAETKAVAAVKSDPNNTVSKSPIRKALSQRKPDNTSQQLSQDAVDLNIAAASTPTPTTVDPFENAISYQKDERAAHLERDYLVPKENFGIRSSLPNTFNGKNGGIAEDADLLAELRAISNKTSSDRFEDDTNKLTSNEDKSTEAAITTASNDAVAFPNNEEKSMTKETLPPLKLKCTASKQTPNDAFDVDTVIAATSSSAATPNKRIDESTAALVQPQNKLQMEINMGIKSNLPNTCNGKNGGVAEDADLLAELRAISNKTSSNRFDDEEDGDRNHEIDVVSEREEAIRATRRKNIAVKTNTSAVTAAPVPPKADPFKNAYMEEDCSKTSLGGYEKTVMNENFGIKSNLPNTFNGKNGGLAEDADLLAELRAISTKASGSRFEDEGVNDMGQNLISESPEARTEILENVSVDSNVKKNTVSNSSFAENGKTSSTDFQDDIMVSKPLPTNGAGQPQKSTPQEQEVDEPIPNIKNEFTTAATMGIKSSLPNTFSGKNGGIAQDEDLLAELRAISNKSSTDRFAEDGDVANSPTHSNESSDTKTNALQKDVNVSLKPSDTSRRPPTSDIHVDDVITAPPVAAKPIEDAVCDESFITAADETENDADADDTNPVREAIEQPKVKSMGFKSSLPNTFNGINGGIAEDADLLAELRAISNKSSVDRFNGEDEDTHVQSSTTSQPAETKQNRETDNALPPTKRNNENRRDVPVHDVVAAAATVKSDSPADNFRDDRNENVENLSESKAFVAKDKPWKRKKKKERSPGSSPPWKLKRDTSRPDSVTDPFQNALLEDTNSSNKSSLNLPQVVQNTFSGKNGGAANDAELLAELNAISSRSSNRFDDISAPSSEPNDVKMHVSESTSLPRSKLNKPSLQTNVMDKFPCSNPAPMEENMGIKSSLPMTFKGTNGGSAEDADLLAELRAISMKTSSNRFDDSDGEIIEESATVALDPTSNEAIPWQKDEPNKIDNSRHLPPSSKQNGSRNKSHLEESKGAVALPPVEHTAANTALEQPEGGMGVKSEFTNTFKGDRGGAAEDAGLLAELRAISKKSAIDRIVDTEDLDLNKPTTKEIASESISAPTSVPTIQTDLSKMNPLLNTAPKSEISITLDGLDDSLASSNWQIRKASYLFLQENILSALCGSEPENQLHGNDIYSSLDDAIIKALGDKNAGALDSALTLSVAYSDCCKGACSEDIASEIMLLLLKGAAFASSRPSTQKTTQELVFKLIEVAPEDSLTADNVIDLIQQYGLKAKKPKVVLFAATLVLRLVQEFGTSVFNVPKLSAAHELLVANSNDKIRAIGIEIIAELCRTYGSKTPMKALVEKLKKSQQTQLDSLIDKQPTATQPRRRLRCKRGVQITTQSPEEALAALKKNEEEEKLKRFESRPAINLLQVLPQTCFNAKIKETKWSEKVAALDALIEAGGEKPYKICSGNYATLLRELQQLLGHTHYLVCSKALAAIGMLAEGVGGHLSSDLRPLLSTIVSLFKDKKVGKAVMSCLDQMFGNTFCFDHFLDRGNSLLLSLDEKKEKNALVRKSVLEFLSRCVAKNGTQGTSGKLTRQHAQDLCRVACDKLKDSDGATRKAATAVVIELLTSGDEAIASSAERITSSLQTSNPRAYKTLTLATKNGKADASNDGSARPDTAPLKAKPKNDDSTKRRPTSAPKSKSVTTSRANKISTTDETTEESDLLSFEESTGKLCELGIPHWDDDAENGGVLAGIQSPNWKQKMVALKNIAAFFDSYGGDGDTLFSAITPLFVVVKSCSKSFQESNFNVAKAILELFTVLFNIHAERKRAPESFIYIPIVKLAAEKIGDRKLTTSSSSCLESVCVVKEPQRVLLVATQAVNKVKSPLVHEAMLVWVKSFSVNFGLAALSEGVQDLVTWILKECESNNIKVKNAARNVLGEFYQQLGPVLETFVKSSDVNSAVSSMLEKVLKEYTHNPNANQTQRKLKCITLSLSNERTAGGSSKGGSASSMLVLPTTDLMATLKSDCIDRMNDSGDKKSWRNRKDALDEVAAALSKCGGLISTEGKTFLELKQLAANLRLRTNDSQSNLKPLAASVIGSLLSHVDDTTQAKLGVVVFPSLVNAAMNDIKKSMRDAAILALRLGTDSAHQNGGGTNASALEAFISSLDSELSDASLKSSGLPEVLSLLASKIELLDAKGKSPVHRSLAKVIVLSLLSSKSGSRSAAEKLLTLCSNWDLVPSASFDKEISNLLPAQQRSVRSFIPKLSDEDQELVNTFKKAAERSRRPQQKMPSSRPTSRLGATENKLTLQARTDSHPRKSNKIVETDFLPENPLQMSITRSVKPKLQRLAMISKGDYWPEYAELPSNDTLQALRKLWTLLLPSSSIEALFPRTGLRTHEDCIAGCNLISKAIDYSRERNDSSFLEMIDLIFKWTTYAVLLRDHTSGFRKLLSMILDLFQRLVELSYVFSDGEANLLLPYLLDKAGVAKLQFKDEILTIFTLVKSEKLYPSQKFGLVCMKVFEKSKSNPSRPLAAELCLSAVRSAGVPAVGRKGLVALSNILNDETVTETKKLYVDFFEIVVEKLRGDTDKLFKATKPSDKVKAMIIERCGNQHLASLGSPKKSFTSPPRKPVPPDDHHSQVSGHEASISSSAVATGNLRARLQKSNASKVSNESRRLPPSIDTSSANMSPSPASPSPRTTTTDEIYACIVRDINFMTKEEGCNCTDIVRCTDAIKQLRTHISNEKDSKLDRFQRGAFREKIESEYNTCMITVISAMEFAFERGEKNSILPLELINETNAAVTYLLRMQCCRSEMRQSTVEHLVNTTISALLDDRIHEVSDIVKATNKVALRIVLTPSLDHSLNALIAVQASVIDPKESRPKSEKFRSRFSRVIEKLLKRIIKDRKDSKPSNPFVEVEELGALLASIDWLIEKIEDVSQRGGSNELLTPSTSMARYLLLELLRFKKGEVRETMEDLGDDVKFIEPLLRKCEEELGMQEVRHKAVPPLEESSFRERLEALKRQRESNGKS